MKTTAVKPMKCEFAEEGILWIDKIATGVGVILYNPQRKFAAGFHVLRGQSRGSVQTVRPISPTRPWSMP